MKFEFIMSVVVTAFRGTPVEVPEVDNHGIILSSQVEGIEEYAMTKYHIQFTKKTIMKTTNAKNNCITKIKIINQIQHTKTHWNHVALLFIFIKYTQNNKITKNIVIFNVSILHMIYITVINQFIKKVCVHNFHN